MNKINVKIYPDGRVDLELSDFAGLSCLDTTRTIENLLGGAIINRRITKQPYLANHSQTSPTMTSDATCH